MSGKLPEITVLSCRFCGHVPVELAGKLRLEYPASVKVVDVGCTGSVTTGRLLKALEAGAQGVLVAACVTGTCHHLTGNLRALKRVAATRRILASAGLSPERLRAVELGIGGANAFAGAVREMTETIGKLDTERAGVRRD